MTGALGTCVVVLTWLVVVLVVLGCGSGARRILVRAPPTDSTYPLQRADVWIGFAAVVAILQIWSLFAPIRGAAVGTLLVLGLAGLVSALRNRGSLAIRPPLRCVGFLTLFGVATDAARGAFGPVSPDSNGPLWTSAPVTPALRAFTTSSGLRLTHPAVGDRCAGALLCTPQADANLSLRKPGAIGHGFKVNAVAAANPP